MEIEIKTNFFRGDPNDHNVVAEIPGTDLSDEIVVFGGHLQSVPVGTGATDNAAGVATAMEVMRIFKKTRHRTPADRSCWLLGRP